MLLLVIVDATSGSKLKGFTRADVRYPLWNTTPGVGGYIWISFFRREPCKISIYVMQRAEIGS